MNQEINYLKKELYELVKKDEKIFDFIQESSIDGLWYWDLDKPENEWMNPKFWTTLGYNADEMPHLSSAWQQIINPEDLKLAIENVKKHIENPLHPYDQIVRYTHKKGHTVWIRCKGLVIRDENNVPMRMLGAHIDITKEKEKSLAYQKQNFRYNNILNSSGIGTWEWNLKTGKTIYNERWAQIIGYTLIELQPLSKEHWNNFIHPDDLLASNLLLQKHIDGETEFYECRVRMKHKLGHWVWIRDKGKVFNYDIEGKPILMFGTHEDITSQKLTEDELTATNNQLKSILKASHQVSIISTDTNGIITTFNKGAENLLGYEASELIGKHNPSLLHLEDEVVKRGKELSEKYNQEIEGFDVFVHQANLGHFDTNEWTYIKKDGTIFPVQLTVTPILNKNLLTGYLGIATDITELKKTETELKLLLELTKNQNDRLLNFAHIVSHNLRSHAGNFTMILDILESENSPEIKKEFDAMLRVASKQLNETVANLNEVVQLNHSIDEVLTKVNVLESIVATKGNLASLIKESLINIEIDVPSHLQVNAVPAYLDSIFLNLISNAIKYRSDDKSAILHISASIENNFCVIQFKDNGIGIDLKRHEHKLFGMYKTFHGNKDARGIGLFITKNQIEAMKGKIKVESTPNVGTTFCVLLTYN